MEEFTDEVIEFLEEKLNREIKVKYPWELLQLNLLGNLETNIRGEIEQTVAIKGEVYVERGTVVKNGTRLEGPVYIGRKSWIGPNAYLRHGTIITGPKCWLGTTEVKNSIILGHTDAGHLTFIGDSIIGQHCNFGAGTMVANYKFDAKDIPVYFRQNYDPQKFETKTNKLGVIMEDNVKTGVNAVILPGSYIGKGSIIGAGIKVLGYVKPGSRIKKDYFNENWQPDNIGWDGQVLLKRKS
jgi:bifunctional UDP-N-acetylglucosamine pyrophosphorylase/glucosamine-1-phosphate N-acetyltransferase